MSSDKPLTALFLISFFIAAPYSLGCNPGTSECFNETAYHACNGYSLWDTPVDCEAGQSCILGACEAPIGCQPGTRECVTYESYHICGSRAIWEPEQQCSPGWSCQSGQCIPPSPPPQCSTPGQTRCAPDGSNTVQVCNGNLQWETQRACDYGCTNGYCRNCRQGSTRCSDNTHYQTCNSDGTWGGDSYCGKNNVCQGGSCMPDPATNCQNIGAVRCSSSNTNMLQKCNNNYLWADYQVCQMGCFYNACRTCSTGERACRDTESFYMCDDHGQWGLVTSCPTGYVCFLGSCQVPTDSQCSAIGQKRCSPANAAMTQICGNNYVYVDYVKCSQGCASGECMVCQPGTTYCADSSSYKSCDKNGQFTAPVPCPAGQSCSDGKCAPASVCAESSRQCVGGMIEVCKGGQWAAYTSCPSGSICTEAQGTAYCKETAPAPSPQPTPTPSPDPQKDSSVLTVAAILAIMAIAGAGYYLLTRKKE